MHWWSLFVYVPVAVVAALVKSKSKVKGHARSESLVKAAAVKSGRRVAGGNHFTHDDGTETVAVVDYADEIQPSMVSGAQTSTRSPVTCGLRPLVTRCGLSTMRHSSKGPTGKRALRRSRPNTRPIWPHMPTG
jgi:hypothetical protein